MTKSNEHRLDCALAVALSLVGETWSALILRDFMIFGGTRRFEQLREGLGISRNVLTERLRHLLDQKIIKKLPIAEGARRMEYKLTRKGWELLPALIAIHQWSDRWRNDPEQSALRFIEFETEEDIAPIAILSQRGKILGPDTMRTLPRNEQAAAYLKKYRTESETDTEDKN